MESYPQASVSLLCVVLCLLFYIAADTTSRFLVPAVTYIASASKMDPSVAGATLLAFANGMPDLISAIASFSGRSKHAGFGVGGLLGSGLVVSCFTLGYLVYLSNGVPINKRPFMRDVVFYLAALAGLVVVYRVGYATVQASLMALVLYVLYSVSVVRMEHAIERTAIDGGSPEKTTSEAKLRTPSFQASDNEAAMLEHGEPVSSTQPGHGKPCPPTYVEVPLDSPCSTTSTAPSLAISAASQGDVEGTNEAPPRRRRCIHIQRIAAWESAMPLMGKCVAVVLLPVSWVRHVTVPALNPATTDGHPTSLRRVDLMCWSFCTPLFVMYVASRILPISHELVVVAATVGLVVAVAALFLSAETRRSSRIHFALSAVALMTSSMWIFLVGHEIVAILHVLGVTLSISGGTLGILVLAWGNSMGDFIGNATLARQGQFQMATAACIAGPIFNTLVGGGLSLLLGCFHSKESTVPLWSVAEKSTLRSGFCILVVCLVSLLAVGWQVPTAHLTKWFGLFLMALYMVFCVATLVEESTK
ncbi:hypothetical protein DYB32_001312 [Aphanomyces invadans]|uniref:Sodium/calcium exchanger membrane region domain-containing protein n=1 Tax=Aphanomyces invadans TaxID=157072 RepID=A0A418B6W5_9STRA|nr:hypothetical protein DYB32_001312 [Aphanomyces invadans]